MRVVIVSKTFVAETAQRQREWIARQPEIDPTLVAPGCWSGLHGAVARKSVGVYHEALGLGEARE
jgi:hypothetical protein